MTASDRGPNQLLLRPGSLRTALERTTRDALGSGALQPIETEQVVIEDAGVPFLVRIVSSLKRKEAARRQQAASGAVAEKPRNPFLPPDPELTVGEISTTHVAVLNKFNVLARHLLIVTRWFEHQETLLTLADFEAILACMAEYDSLGFYNGGVVAGASQEHKHLQLVPLPFAPQGPSVPMEVLLGGSGPQCAGLPFEHAFQRVTDPAACTPAASHALYLRLLAEVGIGGEQREGELWQTAPYNLLVAHDWMLVVPRVKELFEGISVNALGFAGSLFIKDRAQLALIRERGPMQVLEHVTIRRSGKGN